MWAGHVLGRGIVVWYGLVRRRWAVGMSLADVDGVGGDGAGLYSIKSVWI